MSLGKKEQEALQPALANSGFDVVAAAFAHIDVCKESAGKPADEQMIKQVVAVMPGGSDRPTKCNRDGPHAQVDPARGTRDGGQT